METRQVRVAIPVYQKLMAVASEKATTVADASLTLLQPATVKTVEKPVIKYKTKEVIKEIPLKEFTLGDCDNCGKPLVWNLENKQHKEWLLKRIQGTIHEDCKGK